MKTKKYIIVFITMVIIIAISNITYAAIEEEFYSIAGNVIYDILPGTTVNDFKTNMKLTENDNVVNNKNEIQSINSIICSNMKLNLSSGEKYVLSVKGDISGDGNSSPTDVLQLKRIFVGNQKEEEYDVYAIDVNGDNDITGTDLLNMKLYAIETIDEIIFAKRVIIPESLEMEQNENVTIKSKVLPMTANSKLEWKSNDSSIIDVNEEGKLEAHKLGTVKITAKTSNNIKAECNVLCGLRPTEIRLNESEITMSKQGTGGKPRELQIVPTILPNGANIENTITYLSDDTSVATVSENGMITAVGSGTTRIMAKTANDKTAYIDVIVKSDISDFTISLSADGHTYDDYLQNNTIYIAFPNNSGKVWNDGSRKKPNSLQITIRTDTGETPENVTYTPFNSNITVSGSGLITATATPSSEMTTNTRQSSSKITINCEGISKTYDVIIFCATSMITRQGEAGISCDNGGWQSGTTNKGSGHFQRCSTCGQCHRFHVGGDVSPSQDSTHTVQCNLCGGWVHLS